MAFSKYKDAYTHPRPLPGHDRRTRCVGKHGTTPGHGKFDAFTDRGGGTPAGHMLMREEPEAVAQAFRYWLSGRRGLSVATGGNRMERNTPATIKACAT